MLNRDKLFIGGQWTTPAGREMIDVHNAGNGEVMGRIPAAGEKEVDAAVRAARAAFEAWASTPAATRADYLQKISDGLKARSDELAKTIAQEVGMPLKLAGRIQAGLPIANFANYARLVREFKWEDRVGNSVVVREPVGVVAAITPWNYPLHQITLKLAPALGAGCTVVLKPSEVAPFNAFILAEVIEQAGLLDYLGEDERIEGRDLRGLEDDGAARAERRRELQRDLVQRIVPRRDGCHDADGFPDHHGVADAVFPLELAHQSCVVGEIRDRQPGLDAPGELERHAHFLRDRLRQLVRARLQAVGNFLQVIGARSSRRARPRFKRATRSAHRDVHFLFTRRRNASHHLAVAGVVHIDHFAAGGRDPL